jgi:hypothetical protein
MCTVDVRVGWSCRLSVLYCTARKVCLRTNLGSRFIRSVMNVEATLHETVYPTANPNEN